MRKIKCENQAQGRSSLWVNEEVGGGWGRVYIAGWWANLRVPRPALVA